MINGEGAETAYLGLGANLGDREAGLLAAFRDLHALPTISVAAVSSLYETAPVGLLDQPPFLNAAVRIETTLSPEALLQAVLEIEKQRGRTRTVRWGPRVLDIDILIYGDRTVSLPDLTIPHPRLRERAFALVPLAEIAPDLVLPGDTQTIKNRAAELRSSGNILGTKRVKEAVPPFTSSR